MNIKESHIPLINLALSAAELGLFSISLLFFLIKVSRKNLDPSMKLFLLSTLACLALKVASWSLLYL